MLEVRDSACSTCIYRRDNPLDLARLEAEVADPNCAGHFHTFRACHHHAPATRVCRGFWNRHRDRFSLGQVAQRLNAVRFTDAGDQFDQQEISP